MGRKKEISVYNEKNTIKKSTQFWKQVSNGLRTPLNVIKGTADIAQNEIYDIETVKEGFIKIEESSEFLLNVVNDIVDFVTIENDDLEIKKSTFNLNELINKFVAKYFYKSIEENKRLETQVYGIKHEEIIGDKCRLEQILECMVRNSLKYTSDNDRLYFKLFETGVSEDKIFIRFTLKSTNRKIFDILCDTVNSKVITDATDLELYNSHYILLKMGGNIHVILDDDENSEIIIDVPFGINKDKDEDDKYKKLFKDEHIIIICNDKEEAKERGNLLSEMGVTYEYALNSDDALELIGACEEKGNPFSACVIDWNMENMVLQDFINEVHTIFGRDMPIIAMAYNVEKVKEKAIKAGFDYVMEKNWFRSIIFDVLMKNTQGVWKKNYEVIEKQKKKYDFSNKHILVAEDSPLNMEFIVKILENTQADVMCATNGIEAYNIFKGELEGYFDCIIMDVNMPEIDGCEAARKIRNSGRSDAKSIPIFALTANAFQSDIRETLNAGMDGHFSKPIDIERLYNTLEGVFIKYNDKYGDIAEEIKEDKEKQSYNDKLTGLLSLYGFEKNLLSQRFMNHPIGFLFIEVSDDRVALDDINSKCDDILLIKVAEFLKDKFRASDLLSYYGNNCFAVLLNYCDNGISFIERKIREINKMIIDYDGRYVRAGISVGAVYSNKGYFKNIVSFAYDALNNVKQSGKYGCCIMNYEPDVDFVENSSFLNRTIFGTDMFNLGGEGVDNIENLDELLSLILGNNQAVGIMSGTYDAGMPICSISGFALSNLGYDIENFKRYTDAKLENILYKEDIKVLNEYIPGHGLDIRKLRLKHKDGHILWFNTVRISTVSKNGVKMWIASFRHFDENVVGRLCDMDYKTVSVILHKENTIILEKGVETTYTGELKLRKKYNYESLIKDVLVKMHRESEKEEYLYNTSIKNIVSNVDQKGIYEFISYQVREDGRNIPIRYKYRYLDETKDSILWTQEYVENFAESDDITSLLNENGFYRNVKHIISRKENLNNEYVILYVNIRDFKSYNEILGYANGNILLRKYAELFEKSKLSPICCARFHADNFCFLIEKEFMDYDELVSLCNIKMNINGNTINIRANCGIYCVEEKEQKVSIMCDKAVLAMESITNEYAMPYYIFDESVGKNYKNRVFVLNNLERAFDKDEFKVYYQPVCDTKTGKVCSAEALVRWIMPGGKVVSPGVFVPVLENKGDISRLDFLVSDKVRKLIEKRELSGKKTVPVSVNLSRMDFLNEVFLKELKESIDNTKIQKELLRYEVTESAYINVGEDGKNLLEEIRKNKSKIYIDDFGTGYSSLQNLLEVHFDVLKLDMYFIRRIGKNLIAEGIIDSAVRICHSLGRSVIAEGVETEEQYKFLLERGCDYIQGYYFYKPMPKQEFEALLDSEK